MHAPRSIALAAVLLSGLLAPWIVRAASPSGGQTVQGGMPASGFHGSPPGFHGRLPLAGTRLSGVPTLHGSSGPDHDIGTFRGHGFSDFTVDDRTAWQQGAWRHARHEGHYGWWWFAGGLWFYYPAPIYPYPYYIGPNYWYDYYQVYGAPAYFWYHCERPLGYYPFVRHCYGSWEPVPPVVAVH